MPLILLFLFTPFLSCIASITPSAAHLALHSLDTAPVIHFTLARRPGPINATILPGDVVVLPNLLYELEKAEARFNLTKRVVKGNKLVRKAKALNGNGGDGILMGDVAGEGIWYAKVDIGSPPQEIDMDLNMLLSDFYVLTTSSRAGSRFDEFFSKSHSEQSQTRIESSFRDLLTGIDLVKSNIHPFPACSLPTDAFHLPNIKKSIDLEFTHCRPSKYSLNTLGASGSVLGLAPSEHLSQTGSTSVLQQLLEQDVIQRPIFSLMLINGREGVLSVGGTAAPAIDMVVSQTRHELDHLGMMERGEPSSAIEDDALLLPKVPDDIDKTKRMMKRGRGNKEVVARQASWEDGWAWSKVQGAEGWWQILMQSVYVDGARVLQNQAVVVDINCPFILAPPLAAKAFYASVSGSWPLPPPHDNFYAFPCLNPPVLHFEFGGTRFPFMQGGRVGGFTGFPGGRFSLGRLKPGSGYCVGAVVETRMGIRDEKSEVLDEGRRRTRTGTSQGQEAMGGNGMRDVWVIGEGFFRGAGGVFDLKQHRVGFKTY